MIPWEQRPSEIANLLNPAFCGEILRISSARTQLHVWLQSHQEVRIGFAERTRQLIPLTKEAIMFLLQLGVFQVNEKEAGLSTAFYKASKNKNQEEELTECYSKAKIIGKWFARAGTPANIYSMWGVKP